MPYWIYIKASTPAAAYFLDTYPGAAYAFSLRRLSSTYSGFVIRIRESQYNAAADVSFSAVTNKIELISNVTVTNIGTGSPFTLGQVLPLSSFVGSNNGFVATWYDQSGNSNHLLQPTLTSQPQIISSGNFITTSGIGGSTPTISFNGTTQFLTKTGGVINIVDTVNSSGVLVVAKFNATTQQVLIGDTQNINSRYAFVHQSTANGPGFSYRTAGVTVVKCLAGASTALRLTTAVNGPYVNTTFSNASVYSNTVLLTFSSNAPSNGSNLLLEFGRSNAPGAYANAFLSEAIAYSSSISTNRVAMETNINSFYSIY